MFIVPISTILTLVQPKRLYTFLTVVQTKPLSTVLTFMPTKPISTIDYPIKWQDSVLTYQTKSNDIFLIHFLHGIIFMHLIVVGVIVLTSEFLNETVSFFFHSFILLSFFYSSFILLILFIGTFRPLYILQLLRSHHGSSISN